MAAMQRTALAYLDKTAATEIPFWAMVAATIDDLQTRAEKIVATADVGDVESTEAVPGAGSAPGTTIPSIGIRIAGDHLAVLRSCTPTDHRPNARRVDVARSAHDRPEQRRCRGGRTATMRVVATAGHVDHGKSSLVEALTGHESRSSRGGTQPWPDDRSRLRPHDAAERCRHQLRRRAGPRAVPAATCWPASVESTHACSSSTPAEGWKPQSEEHLRILELVGLGHGVIAHDQDRSGRRRVAAVAGAGRS